MRNRARGRREAGGRKQSGRTQEIQRLIGRSLRAVVDSRISVTPRDSDDSVHAAMIGAELARG